MFKHFVSFIALGQRSIVYGIGTRHVAAFSPNTVQRTVKSAIPVDVAALARRYCRPDDIVDLCEAKDFRPPAAHIAQAMMVFSKHHKFHDTIALFDRFARSSQKTKLSGPPTALYIYALGHLERVDEAVKAFDAHVAGVGHKHIFSYNALLHTFSRVGDTTKTLELFEKLKSEGLVPNAETISIIAAAFCNAKRPDLAESFLSNIQDKSLVKDSAWTRTMKGWRDIGDMERAEQLLAKLTKQDGFLYGCCTLIAGYCSRNEVDRALHVINELKLRGYKPSSVAYTPILRSYLDANEFDKALNVVSEMRDSAMKPDSHVYNHLLQFAVQNKRHDLTLSIMKQMQADAVPLESRCLHSVVRSYILAGDIPTAITYVKDLGKTYISLTLLNEVLAALSHTGRVRDVRTIIDIMSDRRMRYTAETFKHLVAFWCNNGSMEMTGRVYNQMRRSGRGHADAYRCYASALAASGRQSEAQHVLETLENDTREGRLQAGSNGEALPGLVVEDDGLRRVANAQSVIAREVVN